MNKPLTKRIRLIVPWNIYPKGEVLELPLLLVEELVRVGFAEEAGPETAEALPQGEKAVQPRPRRRKRGRPRKKATA